MRPSVCCCPFVWWSNTRFLAEDIGKQATLETAKAEAVPAWTEKHRDITSYSKRKGDLPVQKEADPVDLRAVLHRDGSVITAVTLEELNKPDRLYYNLGCKTAVSPPPHHPTCLMDARTPDGSLAHALLPACPPPSLQVGMPFKDIATSDSIFLRQVPSADAKDARTALRRLQESGLGVLAPAAELAKSPLPNAIAVMTLADIKVGVGSKPATTAGPSWLAADGGGGMMSCCWCAVVSRPL